MNTNEEKRLEVSTPEEERRAFLKKVSTAAGGVLAVAALTSEAPAQILRSSSPSAFERGRVSAQIENLRQVQAQDVARGAITNAAIGIAKNLGGAAADFQLSFTLNWLPGGGETR